MLLFVASLVVPLVVAPHRFPEKLCCRHVDLRFRVVHALGDEITPGRRKDTRVVEDGHERYADQRGQVPQRELESVTHLIVNNSKEDVKSTFAQQMVMQTTRWVVASMI